MYALIVFALAVWLAFVAHGVTTDLLGVAATYQSRDKHMRTVAMAESIEQYHAEHGALPVSIAAFGAASGYEQTRSLGDPWQGYAVSPALTDGVWQYRRAVFFLNDPSRGVDANAFLAANACGTGGYDTASSWCGTATGLWYRREEKEHFNEQILTQRARMSRMLQKLSDHYSAYSTSPDKDAAGNPLAPESVTALATLAGFAGAAASCTGSFAYPGAPGDCGDMFDLWGNGVGYQFLSSKHILLVSETPIYNGSGNRVVVGADFDNSLI